MFSRPLGLYFILIDFDESSQRPVVCSFHIVGEKAGRKLFHAPVILKAFAADALAAAGLVGAVAVLEIFVFLTFSHDCLQRRVGFDFFLKSFFIMNYRVKKDMLCFRGKAIIPKRPSKKK